jgi:hypothetical protein
VWPSFILFSFQARIVGRDALCLLVKLDGDLLVLRVCQPAIPIQHMLAFFLVAIDRRPFHPLAERSIHVTHRVAAAGRWHHQIPAYERKLDCVGRFILAV